MRPVLLEMAGFASFREPTTVDFRGAEYFALVGPTGSGKSTVIDALTFALYGSVPRWDDRRTVGLALAPTVGRGTVRFVFDVGGLRFVVARELRRAASGSVSVRSARLERLRDPCGIGGVDEETDPLADGAGAVTTAVEELLGLPFGDFCTCVVLPQGEFAEFLHTEPRRRQEKLVRILGLGIYDVIAREANSEAAAQRQRAEVLTEQLTGFADATEEAEQVAAARAATLEALAVRVGAAAPALTSAGAALAAAEAQVTSLQAERGRLAGLGAPAGLADLATRHRSSAAAVGAAGERAAAAEIADTAAREQLTAASARGPLEQARRHHAELAAVAAELPGARERHEKASAAEATAAADAADADAGVEAARVARDAAARALAAAQEVGRRLSAERDALRAPAVPAGLPVLDRRSTHAGAALQRAATALADAEAVDHAARESRAAAPPRAPLEQALRDHHGLAGARDEQRAALDRLAAAQRAAIAAAAEVVDAGRRLDHAREQHAQRERADLAATLRPTLVVGAPCPVCEQAVTTLPCPTAVPHDGDETVAAIAAVAREHDGARRREATTVGAQAAADAEVQRLVAVIDRLQAGLVSGGGADEVAAALAELDRLDRAAAGCGAAAREARRVRESAEGEVAAVRAELGVATAGLRAARDPLVPLGAPAVDDADVGGGVLAGWAALVAWAGEQAAVREAEQPAARRALAEAERERDAAEATVAAAERTAQGRRRDETAAARAEQEARGAVEEIERRAAQLRSALEGAPSDAEAAARLQELAGWEAAARAADGELRASRAEQRSAERAAAEIGQEIAAAWEALRAARDPLVPLGAPVIGGGDLPAAWSALTEWAQLEIVARDGRVVEAAAAAVAARAARDAVERRLVEDLGDHNVPVPDDGPLSATALPAAAAVLERARGARERIVERRATAATITAAQDEADSTHQVAKMLGALLRSDGFPRWLVASALDALVVDASARLAELSGGQFELTHAGGEFLVVDHADADARRPVKTLSGGETFQASLALALALSAQMSGLAARGATRLESIFLDEGFGTLDEANLEVVAGTLEQLAARGDRVVGVITHVAALAERVPVRFAVRRDQRTSSVERESP